MKKIIRQILKYTFIAAFTAGIIWLMVFAQEKKKNMPCSGYEIQIERKGGICLQDYDVQNNLNNSQHRWNKGKVADVNTSVLEDILRENPYIKDVQVYFTNNANLHISIEQRNPFLRIYAPYPFYMDDEGKLMPIHHGYPFRLRVCSIEGEITEDILLNVYSLEKMLRKDTLLNAMIDQIYIDKKGDFELIPKVGEQRILLGSNQRMSDKLEYLELFYRKGIPKVGWDKYSMINLRYKGQIVCTKK